MYLNPKEIETRVTEHDSEFIFPFLVFKMEGPDFYSKSSLVKVVSVSSSPGPYGYSKQVPLFYDCGGNQSN